MRVLRYELKRGSAELPILTHEGRRVLAQQEETWAAFIEAVRRVTGDEHA
jgi:hypothetical protein